MGGENRGEKTARGPVHLALLLTLLVATVVTGAALGGYIAYELRDVGSSGLYEQPLPLRVEAPQEFGARSVFVLDNYGAPLAYWVEEAGGGNATVWARVPAVAPGSNTVVYVYYGVGVNPFLDRGSPYLVFDFFYNSSLEGWPPSKLSQVDGGSVSFDNGLFNASSYAHLLGQEIQLPALVYFEVTQVNGRAWIGLSTGASTSSGSVNDTIALEIAPASGGAQVRLVSSTQSGGLVYTAPINVTLPARLLLWVGVGESYYGLPGGLQQAGMGLSTPSARVLLSIYDAGAVNVSFIAASRSSYPYTAVVPRMDLSPPAGAVNVSELVAVTTTVPPSVPPLLPQEPLGGGPGQRLVLMGMGLAMFLALTGMGLRLSHGLAVSGAIMMLVGFFLGDGQAVALAALVATLGIVLTRS